MKRLDHVALALDRLAERARRPRRMEMVAAIARSRQKLEDTILALLAARAIDVATGPQLNVIGALVGQPRDTTDDVAYRRRIRAKIAVNRSAGLPDDLLRIARVVVFSSDARINVTGSNATAVIEAFGSPVPDAVAAEMQAFAQRAASSGVRVLFTSSPTTPDETFTLGYPPEEADGAAAAGDQGISVIGDALPSWPASGKVTIASAVYSYSKTGPGGIAIAPALATSLIGGEPLDVVVEGKGLGDSTESGQPSLVPYTSPGTTGGQLADVR